MLEPILGLFVCLALYVGAWLARKVTSEFARDPAFERWCASEPMILALRCKGDLASDLKLALRTLLAPHEELVNLHGGAPWQYYRYDVAVRAHADDVVAIHIVSAIPQRGAWKRRADAADVLRRLLPSWSSRIEEVWMHGQLHPSDARSRARDQRHWIARVDDGGALEVTPMIGKPRWVEAI